MVYRIASALPTLLLGASLALGQGGTGKQPSPTPTPAASPTPKKTTPAKGTGSTKNATPSSGQGKRAESEIAFWESIKNSTDPEDFKAYLQQYPNGTFATLARNRLKKLEAAGPKPTSTPVPSPGKSGTESSTPKSTPGTVVRNKIGMELVWIPSGVYIMGSTNGRSDERPLHPVAINYSFLMGKYEVTQAQWQQVMGTTVREQRDKTNRTFPVRGEGSANPMQYVSWDEAQQFIQKLNEINDGYVYRLPTEEEWEYACRAGTTGDYAGERDEVAWFANNAGDQPVDATRIWNTDRNTYGSRVVNNGNKTHPVGTKKPNAFGLYDVHGNVNEWCQDSYHDSYNGAPTDGSAWVTADSPYRVARGGSWFNAAMDVRSSNRLSFKPDQRQNTIGFRVAATPRAK
ncbi:MAG TPA: SUMF1/EgtB/PvdO family nonheme iron enzyme [Pyrinomonadaceae bacterium]|nr:SUMF1/EgtB/PvdO family nonheme iron enzyme [Pyrinomonadaceae bacterium]